MAAKKGASTRKNPKLGQHDRSKVVSGATKAGLIVAPSRCQRMMRKMRLSKSMGVGGGVFMAGVLQYLMSEILELSGEVCLERKRKTIAPRHMQLAVRGDEELNKMFAMTQISSGGTIRNIQAELFPKNKV